MADKLRTKTKTPCIYYNTKTKKYDVKYNFSVYDPVQKKNVPDQQWAYNCETLAEAKAALAAMRSNGVKKDDKEITLEGAYKLWEVKAKAQNFSPVTIENTQQHCRMIYQFLPKDTKLKDITEDVYYKLSADCREHGYSDETLSSINATFRKLINLCYRKKLIHENILDYSDNIKTKKKDDYRLISKDDFDLLDNYFKK